MPIGDTQALDLYVQSVEVQAKAEGCIRHSPAFAESFEERFGAWRKAHFVVLSRGAAVAKARRGMDGPTDPSLQSFAAFGAKLLDALPEVDRRRRCDEPLATYPPTKK